MIGDVAPGTLLRKSPVLSGLPSTPLRVHMRRGVSIVCLLVQKDKPAFVCAMCVGLKSRSPTIFAKEI